MPPTVQDARKPTSGPGVRLIAVAFFVVVASVIAGVAYRYYRAQKEAIEHEVRNQLLSVAGLKVTEISEWAAQQMDEARVLMADGATVRVMQGLASGTAGPAGLKEIRTWLNEACLRLHYASATFVDSRGNPILSVGTLPETPAIFVRSPKKCCAPTGSCFTICRWPGPRTQFIWA